jgi:hypothetical protein
MKHVKQTGTVSRVVWAPVHLDFSKIFPGYAFQHVIYIYINNASGHAGFVVGKVAFGRCFPANFYTTNCSTFINYLIIDVM